MIFSVKIVFILSLAAVAADCEAINELTPFANSFVLNAANNYILYWNTTQTNLIIKLVIRNNAWMGFGWSLNGRMDYSDVVVFFIRPDGTIDISSRSIYQAPIMRINSVSHIMPLYFNCFGGTCTFIFSRNLILCNTVFNEVNINILPEPQNLIFAWGSSLGNNDILYHGPINRGSVRLQLTTQRPISLCSAGAQLCTLVRCPLFLASLISVIFALKSCFL